MDPKPKDIKSVSRGGLAERKKRSSVATSTIAPKKSLDPEVDGTSLNGTLKEIQNILVGLENPRKTSPAFHPSDSYYDSQSQNIRISNVIIKHDDPKDIRATFETFEQAEDEPTSPLAFDLVAGEKDSNESLNIINAFSHLSRCRPESNLSKKSLGRRKSNPSSDQDLMTDLINHYKHYSKSSDYQDEKENEKLHLFRPHTEVFREPDLSLVLPLRQKPQNSTLPTLNNSLLSINSAVQNAPELSPTDNEPANLGAPYFKLNGAIVDEEVQAKITPENVLISLRKNSKHDKRKS